MPNAPKTITQHYRGTKRPRSGRKYNPYNNRRWQRLRQGKLRTDPLCEDCKPGRTTPAREVHHKVKVSVRPDLMYEPTNLMSLCTRCHSKRTARGE